MEMTRVIKAFKASLLTLVAGAGVVPFSAFAMGGFSENFDAMTPGTIDGQGGWSGDCTVSTTQSWTAPNSLVDDGTNCDTQSPTFSPLANGDQSFYIYNSTTGFGNTRIVFQGASDELFTFLIEDPLANGIQISASGGPVTISHISDAWVLVKAEWKGGQVRARVNAGAWSPWQNFLGSGPPQSIREVTSGDLNTTVYADSFTTSPPPLTGFNFGNPTAVATGVQSYGVSPAGDTVHNLASWIGLIVGVSILLVLAFIITKAVVGSGAGNSWVGQNQHKEREWAEKQTLASYEAQRSKEQSSS